MGLAERSKRQSFLGNDSDERFSRAIVAIIGLCGGGSHVAPQLAHIGIRNFRLFDSDYVDNPNLNRMLGSTQVDADSRRLKVDVIREQIVRIQPSAAVEVIPKNGRTSIYGCEIALRSLAVLTALNSVIRSRPIVGGFSSRIST